MENVAFKQHVYLDLDSFIFFKFNIPYISPSAWAVGFDRDRERARERQSEVDTQRERKWMGQK